MKEIQGEAKTIRKLLNGAKYSIDYYQREYKWQRKQLRELLDDLSTAFLEDHKPTNERDDVQSYGHYFLGSIIISSRDGKSFIIDGQQRLTTLSLLLIYLHRRQDTRQDRVKLDEMIFSEKYGKKSFNLDVAERAACMEALFNGQHFDSNVHSESVQNIMTRYQQIEADFPSDIDSAALPYFADWLIENVHLVEITTYADEDAYTIFETMNDRGLNLTSLDMLKGYLLANITEEVQRSDANRLWKDRVRQLAEFGKEEDADSVRAWLRSQYAQTIRERKKNAQPGDFDRLGTEFHRWIKENEQKIGLGKSADFFQFIQQDMVFYTRHYLRLREASRNLTKGLETVYYNAKQEFTLQYPLLLAPLSPMDSDAEVDRKFRIVSTFVDILIARRAVNYLMLTYSTMSYAVFLVMRDIRRKSAAELVRILKIKLGELGCDFNGTTDKNRKGMPEFGLNQWSKRYIRQILARMTSYTEEKSGMENRFEEYVAEGKNRYEIEHIWADHPDRHKDEFPDTSDFTGWRNSIGGLLLLPKSFNASYGDLPYQEKLPHYLSQNLLARSLHPHGHQHNPGFLKFIADSGLPFEPHPEFKKADLEARQKLYQKLAEEIWNTGRLDAELTPPKPLTESCQGLAA